MFKIQDQLSWIAKALGIDRASSTGVDLDAPGRVVDDIMAVVPAKGWQANADVRGFTETATGTDVLGTVVPDDEMWLVFACDIFHTDGAGRDMRIEHTRRGITPASVSLTDTVANFGNGFTLSIKRPILLQPTEFLNGFSRQAVTTAFTIRGHYVRLELGEIVEGAPYG